MLTRFVGIVIHQLQHLPGRRISANRTALTVALLLLLPAALSAQQFVVDDVEVTPDKAFQIEGWYGSHGSWLLPAMGLMPNLELSTGIGYVQNEVGDFDQSFVLQLKYRLMGKERYGWGMSLISGYGLAPVIQPGRRVFSDLFAYGVLGRELIEDRVVAFANAGWVWISDGDGGQHDFSWGFRFDTTLHERFVWINEVFSVEEITPQIHSGIRYTLIPDVLEFDVSYGFHTEPDQNGIGFNIGFAWTP